MLKYDQKVIDKFLHSLKYDSFGLIPAIAQDHHTKDVLMMAYMNPESILETFKTGYAVYWSRSKQKLWKKGETSGHLSKIKTIRYDCDFDTILLLVEQTGPACHTNRPNCFYFELAEDEIKIISEPM